MGVFEMRDKPKYITAIAFSQNGDIITGDSNGNILFWTKNQNKYQRVIKRVCLLTFYHLFLKLHFSGTIHPDFFLNISLI